jgi:hypothetical protein
VAEAGLGFAPWNGDVYWQSLDLEDSERRADQVGSEVRRQKARECMWSNTKHFNIKIFDRIA